MKVGIFYGGRGVIEDPTLYVLDIVEQVLDDLNVGLERYNLYEYKNEISKLSQTIRDKDGIILATTVEWLGIGGYMTQFLDALWLYADRDTMNALFMQPIVISTTYGERESLMTLEQAWSTLGGISANGICGYAKNVDSFRQDQNFRDYIDKKAMDFYHTIDKQVEGLPSSNKAVISNLQHVRKMHLTPQESEQLSYFVADESKVAQQKEDLIELSEIFRKMIGDSSLSKPDEEFIHDFKKQFTGDKDADVTVLFRLTDRKVPLFVSIKDGEIDCRYELLDDADVICTLAPDILDAIVAGRMTFQRAFSVGDMTVKGSFPMLRLLDDLFMFVK